MFTGIIRNTGKIVSVINYGKGKRFSIKSDTGFILRLEEGITSVAVNGSCLTVEKKDRDSFAVYSSFETLSRTTLDSIKNGEIVNLELPVTPSSLLDGHIVQGHVDSVGRIELIEKRDEAFLYRFGAPEDIISLLVEKDSIAVDGISLTAFNITDKTFDAAVIPETVKNTSLSSKKVGDGVNLEANIFAKYAMKFYGSQSGISDNDRKNKKIKDWLLS
jgi:riboflavin synthase